MNQPDKSAPTNPVPPAPPAPPAATAKGKDGKTEAPKEKKPRRSAFADLYPENSLLKCLVKENPKRGKSKERFEHYFTSKTVGEFLAKGGTYGDIAFDIARKRIEITAVAETPKAA